MEQIQSREAIRREGAQAARDGVPMSMCRYEEGTAAHEEWENGYCTECARTVVAAAAAAEKVAA